MVHMNAVPWIGNTSSVLVCMVPSILPRIKKCGDAVTLKIAKILTDNEGFYCKMSTEFLFWPNGMGENKGCKASWIYKCQHCFVLSQATHSHFNVKREGSRTSYPSCFQWKSKPYLLLLYTRDRSTETRDTHVVQRDSGSFMSTNGLIAQLTATHKECPR